MQTNTSTQRAIRNGRRRANAILERRKQARHKRANALRQLGRPRCARGRSAGRFRYSFTDTTIPSPTDAVLRAASGFCRAHGSNRDSGAKANHDRPQRAALTRILIDRFNTMLRDVATLPSFAHVRFIDLRGTLSTGLDYKKWWANELHPTRRGIEAVTARFARELAGIREMET